MKRTWWRWGSLQGKEQPNDSSPLVCLVGDKAVLPDLGGGDVKQVCRLTHTLRGKTMVEPGRFNPHRNCHQYSTACGSQVTGRTGSS